MKLLAWNCRGLGSPSTIPQLKESIRQSLSDVTFLSETKQKKGFVNTVCRRLKCKDRWEVVDPIGSKGGMLVMWGESVRVKQIIKSDFSIELEVDSDCFDGLGWIVFVYMSTEDKIWKRQWDLLRQKKRAWGEEMGSRG